MKRLPDRNWPVSERGSFSMSLGVPSATTSPPLRPAPGPRSTTQSDARIVSSSCSTTITVLPVSRSESKVRSSRLLSRACRPIDGSSRMYSTPARAEPTCVASRMRWLSPPDRVAAVRSSVRYSSPTLHRNESRSRTSRSSRSAIAMSCLPSLIFSKNWTACATDSLPIAGSDEPPTNTERASARSRAPWHSSHAVLLMYSRRPSRTRSLSLSLYRLSSSPTTPDHWRSNVHLRLRPKRKVTFSSLPVRICARASGGSFFHGVSSAKP